MQNFKNTPELLAAIRSTGEGQAEAVRIYRNISRLEHSNHWTIKMVMDTTRDRIRQDVIANYAVTENECWDAVLFFIQENKKMQERIAKETKALLGW